MTIEKDMNENNSLSNKEKQIKRRSHKYSSTCKTRKKREEPCKGHQNIQKRKS